MVYLPSKTTSLEEEAIVVEDVDRIALVNEMIPGQVEAIEETSRGMEEAKGVVKHVLLAKFKDGISDDQIQDLIKGYASLVNKIEPMKAFQWGTDVSVENRHQGFTHIFESTFESTKGILEYIDHPAHGEFATVFLDALDKILVIDYKPTTVQL